MNGMTRQQGMIYVAAGAVSYGILATFVKYASERGFGIAGLTFSQYALAALVLTVLGYLSRRQRRRGTSAAATPRDKMRLMLFGTSLGFTSSFYYLSLLYVPVSIAIILLMQTLWMGVVLEAILNRRRPHHIKIIGAVVALLGTFLAVDIFHADTDLHPMGGLFGVLAAASFTVFIHSADKVATDLPNLVRSRYLVYGGFVVVLLFWNTNILAEFTLEYFWTWGWFLALFGTVLPPILFNRGMPQIGTGLGGILAGLEIPVSIISAAIVLGERVAPIQWLGISILLAAIVIINYRQI